MSRLDPDDKWVARHYWAWWKALKGGVIPDYRSIDAYAGEPWDDASMDTVVLAVPPATDQADPKVSGRLCVDFIRTRELTDNLL